MISTAIQTFFEPRSLELKSWGISFLGHALIFGTIVLTFSIPSSTRKPEFVFLGPILTEQDVLSPAFHEDPLHYQSPIPLVSRRVSRSKIDPAKLTAVSKPAAQRQESAQRKKFQKILFETITPGPTQTPADDSQMNLGVPRLAPNKLYRQY